MQVEDLDISPSKIGETAQRIIAAVLAYAPLPKVTARGKSVAKRVHSDKKTTDGVVHFVLPKEIGEVEIVPDVPDRAGPTMKMSGALTFASAPETW